MVMDFLTDDLNEYSRMQIFLGLLRNNLEKAHGEMRRRVRVSGGRIPEEELEDDTDAKSKFRDPREMSLYDWSYYFLPEHFSKPASQMHRWLLSYLDKIHLRRGSRLNVLGPRGGAKSTIGTLAFPLRSALEGRESYIWIVSDTRHQALAHLDSIRMALTENTRIRSYYSDVLPRNSRGSRIRLKNGAVLESYGTGQRIRGKRSGAHRPSLIICDDLQNDSHSRSFIQRQNSREWFMGTLLKAGNPRTNVINLATALHRDALAMELVHTPNWKSRIFRAIMKWPENMSLWEEWEMLFRNPEDPYAVNTALNFYKERKHEMDYGAQVLWPEEEPLYELMRIRAESGHRAYEREKQNSPINPELCEWPEEYFNEKIWFTDWPSGIVLRTLALDPSKGKNAARGDYSAYVLLGVHKDGTLYVDARLMRVPVSQLVQEGCVLYGQFNPDAFGVESNQFQDLLADMFTHEFQQQGFMGVTPWLVNNSVSKEIRIRRLGAYLAGNRMRFKEKSPGAELLVEQLQQFPLGDHDDGPDALEMAVRLAVEKMGVTPFNDGLGTRLCVEDI